MQMHSTELLGEHHLLVALLVVLPARPVAERTLATWLAVGTVFTNCSQCRTTQLTLTLLRIGLCLIVLCHLYN
jgi:hypothetical protein